MLSGKKFVKGKNDTLICEDCNAKTAPKCVKCRVIFAPGQSYKKLNENVFYHNECFTCCGPCHKPIPAEFYDVEDGKFLCVDCYDKYGNDYAKYDTQPDALANDLAANLTLSAKPTTPPSANTNSNNINNSIVHKPDVEVLPAVQRDRAPPAGSAPAASPKAAAAAAAAASDERCAGCSETLSGTFTIYDEKKYHSRCFVCSKCSEAFKEKTFFKLNGKPCCRTCHSKSLVENASRCAKCAQPILDTIVTFKAAKYHDYCLVCTQCESKLVGASIYTDKSEKPYCSECFTRKEGKKCAKCAAIIAPNQTNLVFEEKNFHKECFICNQCFKQIDSNESFYKTGDGFESIICADCA